MLTKREIQVLELKKKGLNQSEIAKKLKISQPAVFYFKRSIDKKVKDSAEIFKFLKEEGINVNRGNGELKY